MIKETYTTEDGRTFKTLEEAKRHEKIMGRIEKAERLLLPKRHDNTDFGNGGGYIQLTSEKLTAFRNEYLALIEELHPSLLARAKKKSIDGVLGRTLCDSNSPLYPLWCLYERVDSDSRLWGQLYFKNHPSEATQKELK